MPQAFLDIDIGDADRHAEETAQWERACQFLAKSGAAYGLQGANPDDLDDAGREMLAEVYAGDPAASAGELRVTKPESIRAGRLVIDLFEKEAPKAVANFLALCTGEKGVGKESKKPLHFKGCPFHRIQTGFVAQGGDVTRFDGSGGESIYGKKFNDEKDAMKLKHDAPGVVSMANSGKNSNSSQFFVTLDKAPQCDGKHVVVGRVTAAGLAVVAAMAACSSPSGTPTTTVLVADCGVLP
mmetsp:Transcript_70123/g.168023  ORF Transcript_70123/g.168023 Transcript_70123/m.168023 type:complete len:240 (-) Transcript_70123:100-819(-)